MEWSEHALEPHASHFEVDTVWHRVPRLVSDDVRTSLEYLPEPDRGAA